ncbi:DUF6002 domain-containing protein [Kibdelosporangium persicum]|uniref:Terminase n=1 Tax=Kibdelosporangium persicum TaxID=2698649 RepID=A0ABX2FHV6_9PSEU|nr:DUF6002 family protein [Kibdelosporangium persicum]NRN70992.1 hypothetical protein [Kibdelosporangium persicum]
MNIYADHFDHLRIALSDVGRHRPRTADFEPEFALPEPSARLARYFEVANLRFAELGVMAGTRVTLLDLMGNPATRTVKTLASLVIVARAIRHIHTTGEPVMILTPSSANKATALRDAVLRAHQAELATPEQLRIITVVPGTSTPKLWSSALDEEHNPVCVLDNGNVKTVARQVATSTAQDLFRATGFRLWHTLDLANYQCADAIRAFAEPPANGTRAHAHAVSSAFGLLGHHFGTQLGNGTGSQYFLVQHMATPDMVLSLYDMTPPEYHADPETGLYHQDTDPRYPRTTFDPAEDLEPTFYTRDPATSPRMNRIIRQNGGGGVVVSRYECLRRYAEVRTLLANAGICLPDDPYDLREWSLVMAMTGVLNGIDRGLLDVDEVVVHGSGSYSVTDFVPIPEHTLHRIDGADSLREILLAPAEVRA